MRLKHDVAQFCINGHLINSRSGSLPEYNQKHCKECGAETTINCLDCKYPIRGSFPGSLVPGYISTPSFCPECGNPYPWTKSKIDAAKELAEELGGLTDEEKQIVSQSIDDMVTDNPKTELGATRFKKFLGKATGGAVQALRTLTVDIVSETAAKILKQG